MAGEAAPETTEPKNMPMAQNGSAPRTSMANRRTPCENVSGTSPTSTASSVSISEMMATNSMAMAARASR